MEQDVLETILDAVTPGNGFTPAGPPRLNGDAWIIPFRHAQFGLGQIFLSDRQVVNVSSQRAVAKEIGERLGLAVACSK